MKRLKTITKYYCDNCDKEIRFQDRVWHVRGQQGGPSEGGETFSFDLCGRCVRGRKLPINRLNGSGE